MAKLSELENDMAKINMRLDNVVEESASKTDNYIEQIKSFERQASDEREELEQQINELVTAKTELTEEVIALVKQTNMATESNTELKQMNGELAKEIAKQQVIIHSQTVSKLSTFLNLINFSSKQTKVILRKSIFLIRSSRPILRSCLKIRRV